MVASGILSVAGLSGPIFANIAAQELWNRRLCRGFPGGSGLAVCVVLQGELREEIAIRYRPEWGFSQAKT